MSKYKSVFDIIGPIMIGPSSSHTAGAVAIGRVGHTLMQGTPDKAEIHYYESFAQTHKGHGTDYAIISGLMGFAPDDSRVPQAIDIARKKGMVIDFFEEKEESPIGHPNTAVLNLEKDGVRVSYSACSIGGGTIEVRRVQLDGFDLKPSGLLPMLFVELDESHPKTADSINAIHDALGDNGEVTQETKYVNPNNKYMILYDFDLDNPLPAVKQKEIAAHSSEMIYID